MKTIPLSMGMAARVDDCDWPLINKLAGEMELARLHREHVERVTGGVWTTVGGELVSNLRRNRK